MAQRILAPPRNFALLLAKFFYGASFWGTKNAREAYHRIVVKVTRTVLVYKNTNIKPLALEVAEQYLPIRKQA